MTIRKKPSRDELLKKLIVLAGLPESKDTEGYLSRKQISTLIEFISFREFKINELTKEIESLQNDK